MNLKSLSRFISRITNTRFPIKNYLKAYITDSEIRDIVETKEYGRFATNPKVIMKDFREPNGHREVAPE